MPKISALPAATTVGASDLFAIVQSSTTKKATASLVLSYVQANITVTAADITGIIGLNQGGTNANLTAVAGAMPYSTSTALALSAALTNGQIMIGNTGGNPAPANIVGGGGVSVVNGPNTISITGGGSGYGWTQVTTTSQQMAVSNGYIANNIALVTLTLPATAGIGETLIVQGKGSGLFTIAQNAGQTIHFGSVDTTTGVAGSLTATNQYDSIELVCITANTDWAVLTGTQGTFTVV